MKVNVFFEQQRSLVDFSKEVSLPFMTAKKLAKLIKEMDTIAEQYTIQFQELELQYAQKDDFGNLVRMPDGNCPLIPGKEKEYSDLVNLILNSEVNFKFPPLFKDRDFRNINIKTTTVLMLMDYQLLS